MLLEPYTPGDREHSDQPGDSIVVVPAARLQNIRRIDRMNTDSVFTQLGQLACRILMHPASHSGRR